MWQLEPAPACVRLGHEGHGHPQLPGDLLRPVLEQHVPVGGLEGAGVGQVQLRLPPPPLPLGALHRHAGRLHLVAQAAQQRLLPRALQQVVVLEVGARRAEGAEAPSGRVGVGGVEEVALQLGGQHGGQPGRGGAGDLATQDLPRGLLDGAPVRMVQVAQEQRRPLQPGQAAGCAPVRHHPHVAVAPLPAGQAVAGEGLHLHVHRQQVVAGLDALVRGVGQEVAPGEALPQQAPLLVGEGDDHGIDLAPLDRRREGPRSSVMPAPRRPGARPSPGLGSDGPGGRARGRRREGDAGGGGARTGRRRWQRPAYTASLTTVAPSPPSLGPADS